MSAVYVSALITVALVLLVSGVAKLLSPGSGETALAVMPLPAVVRQPWVRAALPWAEIAVAAGLVLAADAVLWAATAASVVLFALFTVFVVIGVRQNDPASCGCFGAMSRAPMSWRTVVRNLVLLAVAVLPFLGVSTGAYRGPVVDVPWWGVLATLVPAAVLAVILWSELAGRRPVRRSLASVPDLPRSYSASSPAAPAHAPAGHGATPDSGSDAPRPGQDGVDEADEYQRVPIPHVTLRDADGRRMAIRGMASHQARLLVSVNPGCRPCEAVIEELLPHADGFGPVALHMVVSHESSVAQLPGPFRRNALIDEERLFAGTFEMSGTPWAVLLGADGLLAGGPDAGSDRIHEMILELSERF